MRPAVLAVACALLIVGGQASAQTYVGRNVEGGLHWSVSAPENASWRLVCRHPPAIYYQSAYNQRAWINQFTETGQGAARGRLPLDSGSCEVTKTGGRGPVAVAVGRPGTVNTGVAYRVGEVAGVGLF